MNKTRNLILILLTACLWLTAVAPARAVLVLLKGKEKPLVGFLVREDDMRVIVKRVLPDGSTRDEVVLRSDVLSVVQTVDRERLASLKHDEPQKYRDYAEELAEKRQDPEARYTAIRLYLISVWLDRNLAGSSLRGMIKLARSEREEAKFRALAFLLDPDHDRGLLRRPQVSVEASTAVDDSTRAKVLELLRDVRQGKTTDARALLGDPAVVRGLNQYEDYLSLSEVQSVANGGFLAPSLLEKLVRLEASLTAPAAAPVETSKSETILSWEEGGRRDGFAALPVLTLETITEFNPRECQYRDGKWIDPDL